MSLPEVLIWQRIRGHGFRRQHAFDAFILDFYRARDRLCIEIDGQHHDPAYDSRRDAYLAERGVRTVRIAATDVLRGPPPPLRRGGSFQCPTVLENRLITTTPPTIIARPAMAGGSSLWRKTTAPITEITTTPSPLQIA